MTLDPRLAELLRDDAPADAFAGLALVEPPSELVLATLSAVDAAWSQPAVAPPEAPRPANRRWLAVLVGVAVAAAALLLVRPGPKVGDPEDFVARGLEQTSPAVVLKLATRGAGGMERFHQGTPLAPGDQLFFRYQAGADGWLYLVRSAEGGVEVLDGRAVRAGEADLDAGGKPLAWTFEERDADGVFALVASDRARSEAELVQALQTPALTGQHEDAEALCVAARRAGLSCDAAWVEVSP